MLGYVGSSAMHSTTLSDLLGIGLYTIPRASRLTGVSSASITRWVFGYQYAYRDRAIRQPAIFTPELASNDEYRIVTFRDLVEIKFVDAFRRHGVSWKVIRETAEKASRLVQSDHPFSSQKFLTDGQSIFADIATSTRERALLNLLNDQLLFRSVMLPDLRSALEFDGSSVIRWWPLGKRRPVVIDPNRQFGQPVTEQEGVPTQVLATAFASLGSIERVAKWYDVSKKSVKASVEFEQQAA